MFKNTDYKFNHYIVYKKLTLQGYRLVRYNEMLKRKNKVSKNNQYGKIETQHNNKKRKIEVDEEIDGTKKICYEQMKDLQKLSQKKIQLKIIQNLFEEIQKKVPVDYSLKLPDIYIDYCVFMASNKSRTDYNFNLSIW